VLISERGGSVVETLTVVLASTFLASANFDFPVWSTANMVEVLPIVATPSKSTCQEIIEVIERERERERDKKKKKIRRNGQRELFACNIYIW
jgi:heme exporter protein D